MSTEDETKAALRRVCDRYAGAAALGQTLPHELVHEVFASLPRGVLTAVPNSALGAENNIALNVSPTFYRYVAYAAEYWSGLLLRHGPDSVRRKVSRRPVT